jgi:hypothetical protein
MEGEGGQHKGRIYVYVVCTVECNAIVPYSVVWGGGGGLLGRFSDEN